MLSTAVLLTHKLFNDWVANTLRELGAEAVEAAGTWDAVREVHSDLFIKAVKRREEEVLAAAAVAEAALGSDRAIFYIGGSMGAGLNAARGGLFNAAVFIAQRTGSAVVSIDRHFPWGTWEIHLERRFPLVAVYSGADGPSYRYLKRRGHRVLAFPIPPGAGDKSFASVVKYVLGILGEPLVLHLGFDIHMSDPTGHLFVSDYFFYSLGKMLASIRRFYISIECPSSPRVFKSALGSLLGGLRGGEPPVSERYEEGEEVEREVSRLIRLAKKERF